MMENNIIVSSRIRLARNLQGMPFPSLMSEQDFKILNKMVKETVLESNTPFSRTLKYIEMDTVPEIEIYAMVERHIISPEFARKCKGKAIVLSEDESVCIMIGEEDHIRIQVIKEGLSLEECYDVAERIDTLLCDKLHFAYNSQFGFLTECPTNLGTGLRASVMLHLPLLEATKEISLISDSVNKIGFTVRGSYGEGTSSEASLYQLSNQITLGISEKEALSNLTAITKQIIDKEINARQSTDKISLEDSVYRSFGILSNARKLTSDEMMKYLSMIKLGLSMGILKLDNVLPDKILILGAPNMIMRKHGIMEPSERDIKRAEIVRQFLTKGNCDEI